MSPLRAIFVVGAGLLGLATLVSCLPRFRRPTLIDRLAPYLGALGPRRSRLLTADRAAGHGVAAAFQPLLEDLGGRLQRLFGDDGRDLPVRLAASGSSLTASGFRAEQATWAVIGFIGGIVLSIGLTATGRNVSPVAALVVATAFAAIGIVGSGPFADPCRRGASRAGAIRVSDRRRHGVPRGDCGREPARRVGARRLSREWAVGGRAPHGVAHRPRRCAAGRGAAGSGAAVRAPAVRPVRLGGHRRPGARPAAWRRPCGRWRSTYGSRRSGT